MVFPRLCPLDRMITRNNRLSFVSWGQCTESIKFRARRVYWRIWLQESFPEFCMASNRPKFELKDRENPTLYSILTLYALLILNKSYYQLPIQSIATVFSGAPSPIVHQSLIFVGLSRFSSLGHLWWPILVNLQVGHGHGEFPVHQIFLRFFQLGDPFPRLLEKSLLFFRWVVWKPCCELLGMVCQFVDCLFGT